MVWKNGVNAGKGKTGFINMANDSYKSTLSFSGFASIATQNVECRSITAQNIDQRNGYLWHNMGPVIDGAEHNYNIVYSGYH